LINDKYRQYARKIFAVTAAMIIIAYMQAFTFMINQSPAVNNSFMLNTTYVSDITPEKIKRVLYINSYHPGYRWSDQVQAGIADTLNNQADMQVDLNVEYLDGKRYSTQLEKNLGDDIASVWKRKYRDSRFDLIIVSDQDAYNLLKRFRNNILPDVPVVFCGIEDPGTIDKNTTGIISGTDYGKTVKLIMKVIPDVKRIWFIHDRTATGIANRRSVEQISGLYKGKVEFVFFDNGSGLEPREIYSKVEKFTQDEVIFFLDFNLTRSGRYIDLGNFLEKLTGKSPVPVFSHVEMYMDYGVTGGMMNSGYVQGKQAAETGLRILRGISADDILPQPEKSLPTFNFNKLNQYGISLSDIPPESRVINRKENFIVKNLRYFAGGTVLIILEGVLIAWLFRLLKRQRKLANDALEKEKLISRSETILKDLIYKYDLIVEASGQVVYEYIVSTGEITWGKSIYNILGYQPEEIAGGFEQWMELLHPDDLPGIMKSLNEAEISCSFWDERYRFRHKEGHYIWIRDRGFFLPDDKGKVYCQVGMLEDITTLKKSEDAMDFERRQLLSIFDSIDQVIYVSDPFTYEILFANKRLRDELGLDPIGKLCYQELQGFNAPCPFCTNSIILANGGIPYKWEYYNEKQNQAVDIIDRIIRWPDGRYVRFEIAIDITERKRAEKALRESEERNRAMLNALPDMIFVFNREYIFTDFRASETEKLFVSPELFIGKHISEILPPDLISITRENIDSVFATGEMKVYQYSIQQDDTVRYFETRMVLKSSDEALAIVRDVTESKKIEEDKIRLQMQLMQAQKMESVGRLAGGIAHDFNNMLGAITGYSELALRKVDAESPLRRYLEEILKTAGRSADLTRQLLAFARKQAIEPKIISLNNTVENMLAMLRRLIGENISLEWKPCADLWPVNVDPAQMDQILANLTINARDAISGSGFILIETMNRIIDENYPSDSENIPPGQYVVLMVSDSGSGMDQATKEKIFEPFFTTKELGHGTGLGLATVYGIVQQNKGFINVYSEPGRGSSFKMYFPAMCGENIRIEAEGPQLIPRGDGEVIIIVEDEPAIIEIAKSILEELNYKVITAASPDEAKTAGSSYDGVIDLLITDIILPEKNGRELAAEITASRPEMKVLFMSGYTADVIARQGIIEEGISFIQKPFSMKDIALKIKSVLGKESGDI